MTKTELCAIISRVFGLYYFTMFFRMLSSMPSLKNWDTLGADTFTFMSSRVLAFVVLAIAFWFGAQKIGRLVAGKNPDKEISLEAPGAYMACVFVGFGCYLLTYVVTIFSKILSMPVTEHSIVELLIYVALSLFFILGANGLKNAVMRLRGIE